MICIDPPDLRRAEFLRAFGGFATRLSPHRQFSQVITFCYERRTNRYFIVVDSTVSLTETRCHSGSRQLPTPRRESREDVVPSKMLVSVRTATALVLLALAS